ncbi:hypothetical protein [Curtobacterium sp. ME12]|uniref:hypothetical protein n=1 Tax=Curtobacterium sp. ME12 TaxID=2744253 RepID=UPI0015F55848|nr:hypothetical protein [Curtobacterium sp. ME12]
MDSELTDAQTTAIGHSWGLANIRTSETLGTQYDQVASLSGAGMPESWQPDRETTYTDYSSADTLQVGQATGQHALEGNP